MADVTKDMKISDILALNELIAPFLMQNGMGCVSCAASQAESLEEACEAHGIDVDDLTEDLNDVLREYIEIQEASQNAEIFTRQKQISSEAEKRYFSAS